MQRLERRRLGRSPLEVPALCFGAYTIGGGYWGAVDEVQAQRALELALASGMDAIDTAPVYGLGRSEVLVGRALRAAGGRATLMTKVGLRWDADAHGIGRPMRGPDGELVDVRRDSRPETLRRELERSLERLGVEQVDLVQVHARDPLTPLAETMDALAELVHQGLARAVGVSNFTAGELRECARALGRRGLALASAQEHYSLLERRIERELVPTCLELAVGLLAYSPLDQGLLAGAVGAERVFPPEDGRSRRASFAPANRALVNACLAEVVAPVAALHRASIGQVVLAWTIGQLGISAALVGARSPAQVAENADAARVDLAPAEREAIGSAFAALELAAPARGLGARLRSKLAALRRRLGRGSERGR
jgi:aryl-alcohol dehydrogenase-like predicted oxidoreductase